MFYVLPRLYNRKIAYIVLDLKKEDLLEYIYINDSRLGLKVSLNNNDIAKNVVVQSREFKRA